MAELSEKLRESEEALHQRETQIDSMKQRLAQAEASIRQQIEQEERHQALVSRYAELEKAAALNREPCEEKSTTESTELIQGSAL